MAKFIKVETSSAARPVSLIPIDLIVGAVVANNAGTTTLTITMGDAGAGSWVITVPDPAGGDAALLTAYADALSANPGGIISTLVPPLTTAQVPQQPSISGAQGRTVVTTAEVYSPFADCVFTP